MAAISQAEAGVEPFFLAFAGKDLDHTTDGICAIDDRAGAAQHLDSLDLVNGQCFQGNCPVGRAAGTDAIDQHQALSRAGTSQKNAGHTAAPPSLSEMDTGRTL